MTPSAKSIRNHILSRFLMGQLLDPEFTLPPLSNIATQPVGSNARGCYMLHYMEQELKLFRGVATSTARAAQVTHAKLEPQRATSAYSIAKEQLEKNSKNSVRFTWKNLSQAAIHKVRLLEHAFGKCARCRWQSGCLDCNAFKCLRYHLHSGAAKAHELPYLSTGPEHLGQLLKTPAPSTSSSSAAPSTSSSSAVPAISSS